MQNALPFFNIGIMCKKNTFRITIPYDSHPQKPFHRAIVMYIITIPYLRNNALGSVFVLNFVQNEDVISVEKYCNIFIYKNAGFFCGLLKAYVA
jgi:hypothetical protein